MLPQALPYAQAALGSPAPSLRLLGVRQLTSLLLTSIDEAARQQILLLLIAMLEVRDRTMQ